MMISPVERENNGTVRGRLTPPYVQHNSFFEFLCLCEFVRACFLVCHLHLLSSSRVLALAFYCMFRLLMGIPNSGSQ